MPSDYYRFLLSGSRNRFLSTDLQSAFWKRLGKEPSLGFPMDLTNLHALLNDQKAGSHSELTSHQLALRLPHPRQQHLTDGLGPHPTPGHPLAFDRLPPADGPKKTGQRPAPRVRSSFAYRPAIALQEK